MRKIARVDNNQKEIVKALRQMGCSVFSTAQLGNGFPDIIVGWKGYNFLFEIKKPGSTYRSLTHDEHMFFLSWLGQVHIIRNTEEAVNTINKCIKFWETPICEFSP